MPQLEQKILPRFADNNLLAIAVASERSAHIPANLAIKLGLKMPMLLDFDRELFRGFRSPDWTFPLNVLVDSDGTILHTDNGPGLTALEQALEKLFPAERIPTGP